MSEHLDADVLEPSLLDRLLDDERVMGEVAVALDPEALAAQGAAAEDIFHFLERRGWRRVPGADNPMHAFFHVPRVEAIPARCRSTHVPVGGARQEALERLGKVSVHFVANAQPETPEQRRLSARRLREAITRDLGWLLNTLSLDSTQDLDAFPEVRRSVINYGMPSFAGRPVSGIDAPAAARRIETAIASFEPRLKGVRVTVHHRDESDIESELNFEIEADMWSYPNMQPVVLDTRIEVDSGHVHVVDRG